MMLGKTQRAREVVLTTRRLKLAGKLWGRDGGYPILALHGWLDNAASFDLLLPHLDLDKYQVLALDLPGHGRSQHRPAGDTYHLSEYIIDVMAVVSLMKWERFILLGHSLGGAIAMLTAAAYPERVDCLLLIDAMGPLTNPESETAHQIRKAVDRALSGHSALPVYASLDEAVSVRQRGVTVLSRKAATLILKRNLKKVADGYTWRTDPRLRWPSLQRFSEAQTKASLSAIACPALLIAGETGFLSTHGSFIEGRLKEIRQLTLSFTEGGHHLHLEPKPARVAMLIMDFLAQNTHSL